MKHKILLAFAVFFCTVGIAVAQDNSFCEEIFTVVETQPEYPGGQDSLTSFLSRNINYPAEAKAKGIEGRVYVTFVVEKDGNLSSFKILRDIGSGSGDEVVRVLKKMPKWSPGKQRGKPVRVQFTLPVLFRLPADN
jgi:protein TonB